MKIVYTRKDGGISVLHPTQEALEAMTIEQLAEKDVPKGCDYKIVDDDALPSDRLFRDAWEIGSIDLLKAKVIAHKKRRELRDEQLKPLDLKTLIPMYASEAEAERQRVRDANAILQVQIDKARSVEALSLLM